MLMCVCILPVCSEPLYGGYVAFGTYVILKLDKFQGKSVDKCMPVSMRYLLTHENKQEISLEFLSTFINKTRVINDTKTDLFNK